MTSHFISLLRTTTYSSAFDLILRTLEVCSWCRQPVRSLRCSKGSRNCNAIIRMEAIIGMKVIIKMEAVNGMEVMIGMEAVNGLQGTRSPISKKESTAVTAIIA